MGVFRQFPYSNFHEMNMDEIIKIVKTMQEEWNETKEEWASYKEFIDNFFATLDLNEEVLNALRIMAEDGSLNEIMDPVIIAETASWLEENISESYVVDKTLKISGAAADARVTGDAIRHLESYKVEQPIDEYNQPVNGLSGQLLSTNGDGTTEWVNVGQPTDEQTMTAVSAWLDEHPEATTTVTDGSLTKDKFSNTLKLETIKEYVTPQMFGAVGDGITDDTIALQNCINSGKTIYVPNGTYKITSSLTATDRIQMLMGETAEIIVDADGVLDYLIGIKNDGDPHVNTYGDCICGGILNGNGHCNIIVGINYTLQGLIDAVNIKNFLQCGIYIRHNIVDTNVGSGSCMIQNCRIENTTPIDNTYGIYDAGGDNIYDTVVVKDANIGIVVAGGSVAKSCHVWQSDDTYFDTSCAFLLKGQLGALSDCVSDTMRFGVMTDANYVKYSISNFIYYFNDNVTPTAFLDTHPPIVFNFYSATQFFTIVNLNAHLNNSEGKIISDNAINASSIKFINLNLNGMDNAITANTPYDAVSFDFMSAMTYAKTNENITSAIIDAQLTTNIRGGFINYDATYSGWGIVITLQPNPETTVQSMMIAGKGVVTRRYSSGSWNAWS